MVKSPVPYYGSKVHLAPRIARLLPPHDHYIEPFAGGLSVLFAKERSLVETVNDIDRELVTFWRVLRDRADDLVRVCELTPHSRTELNLAQHVPGMDELEIARRVFVRLTQGRAGRMESTGWRYQVRYTRESNSDVTRMLDRLAPAAARLQGVQLECKPAMDIITRYGADPANLIYADPPYLGETRDRRVNSSGGGYRHDMAKRSEHRDLADALRACAAAVVLSGYRSDLYDELYADWHSEEIPHWTGQGNKDSARCEVLWSNRMMGGREQVPLWQ